MHHYCKTAITKAQNRQTGYSKDNLVYSFLEGDLEKKLPLVKNELLNNGIAESVTKTSAPVTEGWSNTWDLNGKEKTIDKTVIDRFCADDDICKTAGFQIVQGRDIDLDKFPADSTAMILNESAVKHMKFSDPIGQIVKIMGWTGR